MSADLPRWAAEMRDLFRSGSAAQFLLHGNVFDVVPAAGKLLSVPAFLEQIMFATYDVVLRYDRSRGVRATRGADDWGDWLQSALGKEANSLTLMREPGAALERQQQQTGLSEELARSLSGQLEILKQRLQQRMDGDRKLAFIEAELERIQQQVELIREQAAMSTDPELLSRRIDDIAATLGSTGQWIRDQQQVYGAMEDLLTEPPPLAPDARARELQ